MNEGNCGDTTETNECEMTDYVKLQWMEQDER